MSQLSTSSKKAATLNPIKTLTGHTSCIISLKYLNDGLTFASGSADYSIKVWDYEKGENIKNFKVIIIGLKEAKIIRKNMARLGFLCNKKTRQSGFTGFWGRLMFFLTQWLQKS